MQKNLSIAITIALFFPTATYAEPLTIGAASPTTQIISTAIASILTQPKKQKYVPIRIKDIRTLFFNLRDGTTNLGIVNSLISEPFIRKNRKSITKNTIYIVSGLLPIQIGFIVHADSEINSIRDLKGKRVASSPIEYYSTLLNYHLLTSGIRSSDIHSVPTKNYQSQFALFRKGDIDTILTSLNVPNLKRLKNKKGLKVLSLKETYQKPATSGFRLNTVLSSSKYVTPKNAQVITMDYVLYANNELKDSVISRILTTLKRNTSYLNKRKGIWRDFLVSQPNFKFALNYHPTSINFFKSKK